MALCCLAENQPCSRGETLTCARRVGDGEPIGELVARHDGALMHKGDAVLQHPEAFYSVLRMPTTSLQLTQQPFTLLCASHQLAAPTCQGSSRCDRPCQWMEMPPLVLDG